MGKLRYITVILLICTIALLSACVQTNDDGKIDNEKLTVMATFYTLYDFTNQIAQDKAEVQLLIPAQVTPHDWEPAPKDIKAIQDADLFVYSSEYFETWIHTIEKNLKNADTKVVRTSEGISLLKDNRSDDDGHDHNHSHAYDPHIWLSPVLAQKQVEIIADALIEFDPDNAEFYAENRNRYVQQLQQLDEEFRETLKNVSKKEFITQHAAFGYLANEYGLKETPIAGLSPSLEPSAAQLAQLKKFANEHNVNTIYFENLSNPKTAQTLANEIGAEVEVLSTLEGLTKQQEEDGLTYIDIMRLNLQALEKSLK